MSPRDRRDHGEGTVFEEPERKRFVGQIDLGCDSTGRRIRPKVVGRSRKEVLERLADLKKQHTEGIDITQRAVTFRVAVRLWLQRGLPGDVTENTRSNYERILNGHVIPALGDKRLLAIRSKDVEEMLDAMAAAGLAASTMRHALNLTRRVLRFAMSRDLVARNVAEPVQTRRGPRAERNGLTVEQAKRLIEVAREDRLANLIVVSLLLGLRPGEAAGLTWDHVALDGPRPAITIAASLRRAPDGALSLVGPKTPTSRRTLEIPPPVVAALKAQRALQDQERDGAVRTWTNAERLVFTAASGKPLDPSNVRRSFSRLAEQAGLEHLHPHMLRHAAASLLSAAGVPIEDISDTLGHRSVAVTAEIYRHPIAPVRSGHMVAMNQLIDAPAPPTPAPRRDARAG